MEFAFDQAERSLQAQELVDGEITAVIGGLSLSLLNGHSIRGTVVHWRGGSQSNGE